MKKLFFSLLALAATMSVRAQIEAGDYFIQNVETGTFLNGANDWGTKASVTKHGQKMTIAVSGSGYSIDSHISNGGNNHFLAAGDNTYTDGGSAAHTITDLGDGIFSIKDTNNKYLINNDGTKVNFAAANADANNAKWKFISMDDVATLMGTATVQAPVDATYYIGDANFSRNNQYYSNWVWAWGSKNNNKNHNKAGNNDNCVVESYHAQFSLTQTMTVPNGVYAVTAQGFYRQDGSDNTNLPYFFANDEKANVPAKTGSENSMANASTSFSNGLYTIDPIYVQVTDGTLHIGVSNMNNDGLWVIFDNFEMKYYGDVTVAEVLLAEYVKAYNEAMAAANAVDQNYLSEADKTALNTLITNNTVVLATATQEQLETAAANLNTAVPAYAYKAKVGELAAQGNNTDFTSLLVNPSFETGNMNGWTNNSADGMWTPMTRANAADPKVGVYWVEKYAKSGKIDVSQTLTNMPAGHYQVSVLALDQASKTKLIAQCGDVTVETPIVGGTKAVYTADIMLDDNSDLKIGLYCESHNTNSWVGFDDFHLTYVSAELPELPASVTGAMNASVVAAQTDAVNTYNTNKTAANYNAAVAAINAAQASKDAYVIARATLDKALSAKGTTFTTSNATDYATAVAALEAKYTNGEYTDDEAKSIDVGTRRDGLIPAYMLGGWSDDALYINTWSTEGDNDGSNFKTPFYEYWVADANALADKTITGTLTDLENGLYSVSADVRVRSMNGVAATEATGINFVAGNGTYDGSEGNGTVDATEGAQIGESQMSMSTVKAYALVKDGNLTANLVVKDANISWLAFQNVTYVKVRDLTPAEAAVTPTAIALDKTEATLTAAENTVTLTPSFTPNDATETVTWETSDANVATVANGVVTGVAPGTATITVKSTLDENVKATCEVTVEYAETAYETSIEAVDAENKAAINVSTLSSSNLIKNGSFEYPNGVANWTAANNVAMTIGNFQIGEEDGNHYLKATDSKGSTDAKSIGTAWSIEAGKTYVFSYKVKNGSNGNSEYHKVSLTNTPGTETKQISDNATPVTTEWTTVSYQFTNSDNYQYVQFRGRWLGNTACFDDFYLAEVTETSQIGNVEYAKSQIPAANVGTGAFQYSQDAIDATNALVKGTATVKNVEDAIEAMTTLNAPAAGKKFNVVLTYDGWTYDNKAVTYIANGRNDAGNYNIQYKAEANANYAQAFTMTKVEGNKYKMSQIDNDGVERYISTGVPYGGNTSQIRTTTDATKALVVEVRATATEGKYNLWNTEANQFIGSQDAGVYTVNSHIDFNIVEATKATATLKITTAKYGTFMAPFDAKIPDGVTVYAVNAAEGDVLTLEEAQSIKANTAYIVNAEIEVNEDEVNEDLEGWGLATANSYTSGLLTGVYTMTAATDGSYILQNNGGKVGFYKVDNTDKQLYVGANRCYLTKRNSSVKAFFFAQDDEDGINAIEALTSGKAEIYNLNGQKLNSLQKGINIVNGQKIMVK